MEEARGPTGFRKRVRSAWVKKGKEGIGDF